MLSLFIIFPLATAFKISIFNRWYKHFGDIAVSIVNLLLVMLSFYALYKLNVTNSLVLKYNVGGWNIPYGITMVVDHLSVLMLLVINVIAFFVGMYSISYMEKYTDKGKYYTLFMLMVAGMNGVVISGDIFNMFVFLEIASIASYSLVAFGVEADELEAAFKYLVLGTIASSLILLSIAMVYGYTSTLNLADIASGIKNYSTEKVFLIKFVMLLFVIGCGIKSAVVPFHSWLPDAHPSAPAPISAMLSGVLIKTLGIYILTRMFFNIFFVNGNFLSLVYWLGIISMIVGVVLALYQWDYKRLLAYSSISQVGYVFLGIGLGTPLGILGGIFHLVNHSVFKSLLFLTSGALEYSFGTRDLKKISSDYGNVNKHLPVTTFCALIGSLSIGGVPPFNGFWSKLIIIIACIESKNLFAGFVAIGVSLLTMANFLKVLKYGFYSSSEEDEQQKLDLGEIKEVPCWMKFAMIGLVILCFLMGFLVYPEIKSLLLNPIAEMLSKGYEYSKNVLINI
jgi:multicomponent Na+:H+ antiporter subunit D